MKTIFVFEDGTEWEWEDEPTSPESCDIKMKYFPTGYPEFFRLHPDIVCIKSVEE